MMIVIHQHISSSSNRASSPNELAVRSLQFSNLYGVAHTKGNVLYTSDGNKLISPVGNRVSVFDLVSYAHRVPDARRVDAAI